MKKFIVFGLLTICVSVATGYGHSSIGFNYANTKSAHSGFTGRSDDEHAEQKHLGDHNSDDDGGHEDHHVDYYAYPKYKFEYGVEDHKTGDNHKHWEQRDGDSVKGGYTIAEPDGTKRIVEYAADKHSGFHAIVTKVGHADHPTLYGHGGEDGGNDAGGMAGHGGDEAGSDTGHGYGFTHGH